MIFKIVEFKNEKKNFLIIQ